MSPRAWSILRTSLLAAVIVVGLVASTAHIQKFRYRPYLHDSLYLPSGAFLESAALGYKELVADMVWFQAVQYYGDYRLDNHGLDYFEGLINIVTQLDPYFIFAYVFGGMVISHDMGENEAATEILKRGMARNPTSWRLPFEIGFINYVNGGDYNLGARYFDLASKMPNAPEAAVRFAAHSYSRGGSAESSLRIWEEYLETTDNPYLKELAERYIEKIKAGESVVPVTQPEGDEHDHSQEEEEHRSVYAD